MRTEWSPFTDRKIALGAVLVSSAFRLQGEWHIAGGSRSFDNSNRIQNVRASIEVGSGRAVSSDGWRRQIREPKEILESRGKWIELTTTLQRSQVCSTQPRRAVLAFDSHNPLRQCVSFPRVVGDQQSREGGGGEQLAQFGAQSFAQGIVERREWFVEQEEFGTAGEDAREGHSLLLPAGKLVRIAVRETVDSQ